MCTSKFVSISFPCSAIPCFYTKRIAGFFSDFFGAKITNRLAKLPSGRNIYMNKFVHISSRHLFGLPLHTCFVLILDFSLFFIERFYSLLFSSRLFHSILFHSVPYGMVSITQKESERKRKLGSYGKRQTCKSHFSLKLKFPKAKLNRKTNVCNTPSMRVV